MADRVLGLATAPTRGRRIIFLHVPKCAGTALAQMLIAELALTKQRRFGRGGWLMFHDHLMDDRARRRHLRRAAAAGFVFGHFHLGTYEEMGPRRGDLLVTSLRDPAERLRSSYRFALSQAACWPDAVDIARMSFADFLRCPSPAHRLHVDNTMTRLLGGHRGEDPSGEQDWRRLLDRARRAIDGMDHLITCGPESALPDLLSRLGIDPGTCLPKLNVTPEAERRRGDASAGAAEAEGLLDQATRYDRLLWAHAQARLGHAAVAA